MDEISAKDTRKWSRLEGDREEREITHVALVYLQAPMERES